MKYVLDTNTVSAVMRSDAGVLKRLKESNRRDVLLPQPVVAEIAYGIARLPRSKRRRLLEERFGAITGTFERIEWTDGVSTAFGEIKALLERKGRRIEDFDAAIAAHAVANRATLVSANVKHMASVPDLLLADWLSPR
jgi:tRNA(fMet)-specific endonuclease VapC